VIVEEAIESSISNIEMSKSEKSLQRPLMLARLPLKDNLVKANLVSKALLQLKNVKNSESGEQSQSTTSQMQSNPLTLDADPKPAAEDDEIVSNIDNISDQYADFIKQQVSCMFANKCRTMSLSKRTRH
jgi:hypothetical protein